LLTIKLIVNFRSSMRKYYNQHCASKTAERHAMWCWL